MWRNKIPPELRSLIERLIDKLINELPNPTAAEVLKKLMFLINPDYYTTFQAAFESSEAMREMVRRRIVARGKPKLNSLSAVTILSTDGNAMLSVDPQSRPVNQSQPFVHNLGEFATVVVDGVDVRVRCKDIFVPFGTLQGQTIDNQTF